MKSFVALLSVLAIVQSAVIVPEHTLLESPLERTSVVGPSGTITVDKNIPLVKTELHAVEPVLKIAEPSTVIAEPVVKTLTPVVPEVQIVDPVPALKTITPVISDVPVLKTITPFVGEVAPVVPHYSTRYVAPYGAPLVKNIAPISPYVPDVSVVFVSVLSIAHAAVLVPEHTLVESSLERTSIIVPSGTIPLDKNIPLMKAKLNSVDLALKFAEPSSIITEPVDKTFTSVVPEVQIVNPVEALKTIVPVVSKVPYLKITPFEGEVQVVPIAPHYNTRLVSPYGALLVRNIAPISRLVPDVSVALVSVLALAHAAVIVPENTIIESPLERTSVVGPSGTITVDKNVPLVKTELHAVEPVLKFAEPSTVIAEPVLKTLTPVVPEVSVVDHVPALKTITPVVGEVPALKTITPVVGEIPALKTITPVVGEVPALKTITPLVGEVPVAPVVPHYTTPLVAPYGLPLVRNIAPISPAIPDVAFISVLALAHAAVIVPEHTLVESPLERTSVVGPSGTITVDKNIPLLKTELRPVEPVLKLAEPSTVIAEPVVKTLSTVVPEVSIVDHVPALKTITPVVGEVPVAPLASYYGSRFVASYGAPLVRNIAPISPLPDVSVGIRSLYNYPLYRSYYPYSHYLY
ncbi:hypothetical protein HHI36_001963 [Cryptolaemus montrouzieri]|uniref:Uncharacterized protein n=1 Tax=Cryptolaemus montrouzieri TaxID=559131 RepID=A0ABD2P942_9CUCU